MEHDLRKAAEMACDGWENDDVIGEMDGLMKALRQALAQQKQEQEPYGYFRYDMRLDAWVRSREDTRGIAFYTAPPKKEWIGLTDEDWNRSKHNYEFQKGVDWSEQILKGKNT